MAARVSRPQWARDQLRQEPQLARLTAYARRFCDALDAKAADEVLTNSAYAVRWQVANCRHAGCTDEQLLEALRQGGVVSDRERAERVAYLESVAAGLPEDLAQIIQGFLR